MIEPKANEFYCYLKSIFLLKEIEKKENNDIIIHYYFRTSFQPTTKLDENSEYLINFSNIRFFKKANKKQIDILTSSIYSKYPNFDFSNIDVSIPKKFELKEKECIEFLKSKGYIVYKQV